MNSVITAFTLLLTIFVALTLGIYAGHALLMGMFKLMAHRTEPVTAPALVTSEAHGGD